MIVFYPSIMKKKIIFGFILSALNIAIIEIGLRLFNYIHPTSIFHREDYNQYRGEPLSDSYGYRLNSHGFKDVEYAKDKPQGTYRIVGVGDSFTFGVPPYPHNFLTLLEVSLAGMPSLPPVEIINMGICSTGPPDYLALVTDEVLDLKPDMVLLSFFIGNDIEGSSRDSRKRKMYSYSYLSSALYYLYKTMTGLSKKSLFTSYGAGNNYCDSCSTFKPEQYLEIGAMRSYVFHKGNMDYLRHANDALAYLKDIKKLCDRSSVKLVVALIPDEMQINETLRRQLMTNTKVLAENWDNSQPNWLLGEQLKNMGVPVVDLLSAFATFPKDSSLYLPNDSHWNILGNRLAARELSKAMPGLIKQ